MLDLGFVREHLQRVEEALRQRGMDTTPLIEFQQLDTERRALIQKIDTRRAEANLCSRELGKLLATEKKLANELPESSSLTALRQEIAERRTVLAAQKAMLQSEEPGLRDVQARFERILRTLPNIPHETVPVGSGSEDNVEVRRWGQRPEFRFVPKPHDELGESLGILDFERAAKISGSRFVVYWDVGAKLERALANFMLDLHTKQHGYTEVLPPFMVNADSMYGTGNLPKFEQDLFKVPTDSFEQDAHHLPVVGEKVFALGKKELFEVEAVDGWDVTIKLPPTNYTENVPRGVLSYRKDFYLIPTAEVPVTNLYRDETLDGGRLPISLTAWTPCFRSEAGSYGKDVRGLIRQHQFQKVELVKFAHPEHSYDQLEKLTRDAEDVLQQLGLHYRVVALCTGDMGFGSAKTYDLEVWLPSQNTFREISSCSNFEAFQARRANIRFKPQGSKKSEFVHTLNGSGLAIGRTWLAILENYQQADGSVVVPEALRPYLGVDTIKPRKA